MSIEELTKEISFLKEENSKLQIELEKTKEHLKKYTAPSNMKKYYQNHKEEIIKKVKEYKEKNNYKPIIDVEKRKEYNKTAYQKRKEKLENQNI
jgi:regulator of replication initiation timing